MGEKFYCSFGKQDAPLFRNTNFIFWVVPKMAEAPKPQPEGERKIAEAKEEKPLQYVEFLSKDPNYGLTYLVKLVRDEGTKPPYEDYATVWRNDPLKAAEYLERYFPEGPGKAKMIEGLRAPAKKMAPDGKPIENPDFADAYKALLLTIEQIKARDTWYATSQQKRLELLGREKSTVSETVKSGLSNALNYFKEAPPADKLLILAVAAIGIKAILEVSKWKIGKGEKAWTVGKLGFIAAAGIAFNEAFRLFSKDRRSLVERFDIGTQVENLQNTLWFPFMLDHETGRMFDKPNEVDTALHFGAMDFRRVFEVYQRHPVRNRERFSEEELHQIGFPPAVATSMIDDRKLKTSRVGFEIVDKLVKKAGSNWFRKAQKQMGLKGTPDQFQDYGIKAIQEKYYEGANASRTWTFEEIMTNEYKDWAEIQFNGDMQKMLEYYSKEYKAGTMPIHLAALAGSAAEAAKGGMLYLGGKIKGGLNVSSNWVRDKWKKYFPKFRRFTGLEKAELEKDIHELQGGAIPPKEVPLEVPAPGKIIVMGIPMTYKKEKKGGKTIFTIDGDLEFDPSLGPAKNKANADKLKVRAKEKLTGLVKGSGIKGIDKVDVDKFLEWNAAGKRWRLSGIDVKAYDPFGLTAKKENIFVGVSDEGKVELWLKDVLLTDLDQINNQYLHAVVIAKIYDAYPALKGIPTKITKLDADKSASTVTVKAEIGGLDMGDIALAYGVAPDFTGKLDKLALNDSIIKELWKLKANDKKFRELFENLYQKIAVEAEGIGSRLGKAWEKRVLWVIPNVEAFFTGQILERRWQYILDYKMAEIILKYEKDLNGKTIADIAAIENNIFNGYTYASPTVPGGKKIPGALAELTQLSYDIGADPDIQGNFPKYLEQLEEVGMQNPEYKAKFRNYIRAISQDKFNYAGASESDFMEGSHICYVKLLQIWTHFTSELAGPEYKAINKKTGAPYTKAQLDNILDNITRMVETKLEKAQMTGPIVGRISPDEIPDAPDFEEIEKELQSKYPGFKST